MIIHPVEQNTPEWEQLKLGKPSASEFHKIVTPKGKLSASATKYAYRLIAEEILQRPMESLEGLTWIELGKLQEADAAALYEFENDVKAERVGFITTDDRRIGASPDRLIGEDGLLEIKCVAPQTQVCNMINGMDGDYIPQTQGQLYVAEREWNDWYSYNLEFPPVKIRTYRDEAFIAILAQSLKDFCDLKAEMMEKVCKQGFFADRKFQTIVDKELGNGVVE